jgi:hypothetical protein
VKNPHLPRLQPGYFTRTRSIGPCQASSLTDLRLQVSGAATTSATFMPCSVENLDGILIF